jgi:hypothetical protein
MMHDGMVSIGFRQIPCEYCIYFHKTEDGTIITGIHVDNFLAGTSSDEVATKFKADLTTLWEISDLGEARFCVGIAIEWDWASCLLQTALIDRILAQFGMTAANPISTPMDTGIILSKFPSTPITAQEELELKAIPYRCLIGHLMYLTITTRPDISLAMTKLSQFLDCYHFLHWLAAKHVLHYLAGTHTLMLRLGGHVAADLVSFSDASYACCPDTCYEMSENK